jgi:hypothetical protein
MSSFSAIISATVLLFNGLNPEVSTVRAVREDFTVRGFLYL